MLEPQRQVTDRPGNGFPTGTGTEPDTQGREQKGVAPNKIVATRCLGSNPANGIQFHRPFVSVTAGFSIYGWRPDKRRQL